MINALSGLTWYDGSMDQGPSCGGQERLFVEGRDTLSGEVLQEEPGPSAMPAFSRPAALHTL